jgi:hypothetical protein
VTLASAKTSPGGHLFASHARTKCAPGAAPLGMSNCSTAVPWALAVAVPRSAPLPVPLSQRKVTAPGGNSVAVAVNVAPGTPLEGEMSSVGAARTSGAVASESATASRTSTLVARRRRSRIGLPVIGLASLGEPP